MNSEGLKTLIKKTIIKKMKKEGINKYQEYKVLNEVPNLTPILIDLMSEQFSLFVRDIHWVSPKPPTFRIILENGFSFYLSDLQRSWVAEVEGKQYYLLNLGEEEQATQAITRVLKYGEAVNPTGEHEFPETPQNGNMEAALEEPLAGEEETPELEA